MLRKTWTESDDLIKISGSFESIRIEINMEKTKNIICGCIYRHPPNTHLHLWELYFKMLKVN